MPWNEFLLENYALHNSHAISSNSSPYLQQTLPTLHLLYPQTTDISNSWNSSLHKTIAFLLQLSLPSSLSISSNAQRQCQFQSWTTSSMADTPLEGIQRCTWFEDYKEFVKYFNHKAVHKLPHRTTWLCFPFPPARTMSSQPHKERIAVDVIVAAVLWGFLCCREVIVCLFHAGRITWLPPPAFP